LEKKDYLGYTARDLALDEYFQQWVLHPDLQLNHFWNDWIENHPEKKETVRNAAALVRSVGFHSYPLTDNEKDRLWDAINDRIMQEETEVITGQPPVQYKMLKYKLLKYAAAVVIGIMITIGIKQSIIHNSKTLVSFSAQSPYGGIKRVFLPDSSEVVLNANSKLIYTENDDNQRQVWLEGEAYFQVRHTVDSKSFIVHTYNNVSVCVLGTRFNVNSYGAQVAVTLQQGSIRLDIPENTNTGKTELYLKPGERVSYNKTMNNYTRSKVNAEQFITWTSGKLLMNNYTLKDAKIFMKQVFDQDLIIQDSMLLQNKVSGSMPIVYNADTMLIQFQQVFKVKFRRLDNKIMVQKK
jgi:ferric-dicitrate binding protein FerR (iron transport regulator)